MSSLQKQIEGGMDEYLVKKSPLQLPAKAKKVIVEWAPWVALIVGILSLLSALSLWSLARDANRLIDVSYEIGRSYGVETVTRDVGTMVYVSIIVLVAQGAILLAAFKGLQAKNKQRGWDLLLLSTLLGLAYGVSTLFIGDFRSGGDFVFSILGALVGLYILAQIKSQYKGKKTS